MEGDASPFYEIVCFLKNANKGGEVFHPQRGDVELHVGITVGLAMEAYALVVFLGTNGDGFSRMGGVPPKIIQAVAGNEQILSVAQVDGILCGRCGQDSKDGRAHSQQDGKGTDQGA